MKLLVGPQKLPRLVSMGFFNLIPSDGAQVPAEWEVAVQLDDGRRLAAGITVDGRFSLAAVPAGVHLLDVVAHGLVYPTVRLDVGIAEEGEVTASAADTPGVSGRWAQGGQYAPRRCYIAAIAS